MKKINFLLLFFFTASALLAHRQPQPGGWAVEGTYLYLLPSIDDTYFVLDSPIGSFGTNGVQGTRKNNDFCFASGFRAGGTYAFCECDRSLSAYYTRLKTQQTRTVSGQFLTPIGSLRTLEAIDPYAGSATSTNDLLYQRVDGLLSQQLLCCCNINVFLHGGLEYAYFRLNEQDDYRANTGAFASVNEKVNTWGVGPQVGFRGDYDVCTFNSCCPGILSVNVLASGALLASKTSYFTDQVTSNAALSTQVADEATWRIIPALHLRFGFNYLACFSCFNASLEVGYEFNSYLRNGARVVYLDDSAQGLSTTNFYNLDLQGLYVSAIFSF